MAPRRSKPPKKGDRLPPPPQVPFAIDMGKRASWAVADKHWTHPDNISALINRVNSEVNVRGENEQIPTDPAYQLRLRGLLQHAWATWLFQVRSREQGLKTLAPAAAAALLSKESVVAEAANLQAEHPDLTSDECFQRARSDLGLIAERASKPLPPKMPVSEKVAKRLAKLDRLLSEVLALIDELPPEILMDVEDATKDDLPSPSDCVQAIREEIARAGANHVAMWKDLEDVPAFQKGSGTQNGGIGAANIRLVTELANIWPEVIKKESDQEKIGANKYTKVVCYVRSSSNPEKSGKTRSGVFVEAAYQLILGTDDALPPASLEAAGRTVKPPAGPHKQPE